VKTGLPLAALYALRESGGDNAVQTMIELYDQSKSARFRARVTGVLSDIDSPKAFQKLTEIVSKDSAPEVRRKALEGIAEKETPESVRILKDIVQEEAVQALADLPDNTGLSYLIRVAKTHADQAVRIEAIETLGEFHDPAAVQALVEIIRKK
jgi:HEAT repeat protein